MGRSRDECTSLICVFLPIALEFRDDLEIFWTACGGSVFQCHLLARARVRQLIATIIFALTFAAFVVLTLSSGRIVRRRPCSDNSE